MKMLIINYTLSSASELFTVNKISADFTSSVTEDAKVGDNVTITVKGPADATGNVSVVVDGSAVYEITLVNGTATVNITLVTIHIM